MEEEAAGLAVASGSAGGAAEGAAWSRVPIKINALARIKRLPKMSGGQGPPVEGGVAGSGGVAMRESNEWAMSHK